MSDPELQAHAAELANEVAELKAQLAEGERQLKEAREALTKLRAYFNGRVQLHASMTKLRAYFNGRVQLHASMDYPQGTDKISQQYRELWTDICEISSIILGFELGILSAPAAERKEGEK